MPSYQCHAITKDARGEAYSTATYIAYCDTPGEARLMASTDLGVPASRIQVQEISEYGFGGANVTPKQIPGK